MPVSHHFTASGLAHTHTSPVSLPFLQVFYGDARRPDVLRSFMSHEEDITSVVVTLDDERDCTRAVRALRRQYPTAKDMPIFVRAVDEQV
jgi:hypothetical protein